MLLLLLLCCHLFYFQGYFSKYKDLDHVVNSTSISEYLVIHGCCIPEKISVDCDSELLMINVNNTYMAFTFM